MKVKTNDAKKLPTLHRFPVVTSTQDAARTLLDTGRARRGHIVVADEQTNGRGRYGRSWASPAGGLYATLIVAPRPIPSLACGVAIARALEALGLRVDLKWPNDVESGERKMAGILVETVGDQLLIGIGVNLSDAPLPSATSTQEAGVDIRRGDLLLGIWQHLEGGDPEDILPAYRRLSTTIGRRVRITSEEGETIEGKAIDIDEEGRLLLQAAEGIASVASGTCEHISPSISKPAH